MSDNKDKQPESEIERTVATKDAGQKDRKQSPPQKIIFDDIEINLNSPHTVLNKLSSTNDTIAYTATGKDNKGYVAFICENNALPRISNASAYKAIQTPMLMPLIARGVADNPLTQKEVFIFIYEDVARAQLRSNDQKNKTGLGWTFDEVLTHFIKPTFDALVNLQNENITHGAIRLDNIFYTTLAGNDGKHTDKNLVLGDCLSSPVSSGQSAMYESYNRGQANQYAHGGAHIKNDIYAMGVCVMHMLKSEEIKTFETDKDLIRDKILNGAYATYAGKEKFSGRALEFLKGTLQYDIHQRWDIKDIQAWIDGKNLSPKQEIRPKKAERPFIIDDQKYFTAKTLALDIFEYGDKIIESLINETLQRWVKRSLSDKTILENIEESLKGTSLTTLSPIQKNKILSVTAMALNPYAPIQYKDVKVYPNGLGNLLAKKYLDKEDISPLLEIIQLRLPELWYSKQDRLSAEDIKCMEKLDSVTQVIKQTKMGYGIERLLYTLAPDLRCLSDTLSEKYVHTSERFINVVESTIEPNNFPYILDRHSTAFISVKDPSIIDNFLFDMNSPQTHIRVLGELRSFARIQRAFSIPSLKNTSQALYKNLEHVFKRIHDTKIREKISSTTEKHAKSGNIIKMLNTVDNTDVFARDLIKFKVAMGEYNVISNELKDLEKSVAQKENFETEAAQRIAAVTSCLIAALIIIFITVMTTDTTSTF